MGTRLRNGYLQLFREANAAEEQAFREWARKHYTPLSPISGLWHPVVQDECRVMNAALDVPTEERERAEGVL
jgi:alpha-ketoglutarate-dependent taurine dioxygenase